MAKAALKDDNLIELSTLYTENRSVIKHLAMESGVNPSDCCQCGKCSAGCPVAFAMDHMPRQIIRMLQLGMLEQTLRSRTIWLCAGCDTCHTRCPHSIDLPHLMETLRILARKRGLAAEKKVTIFEDLFLDSVERFGRVFEMGLIMAFNLKSREILKDVLLAPAMLTRGKIALLPHKIKDGGAVKRIFARVRAMEGEQK
jgi:heterodisulfide reductase subunit C